MKTGDGSAGDDDKQHRHEADAERGRNVRAAENNPQGGAQDHQHEDADTKAVRAFDATIIVTRHPTRIRPGYEPVFHSSTIQQPIIFEEIYDKEYLVVGDVARVRMMFKKGPEMLRVGDRVVTREANTRCIGTVTTLVR